MIINESKRFQRTKSTFLEKSNKNNELHKLEKIITLLKSSDNMNDVINSPVGKMYYIQQKKGDLKLYFSARVSFALRLIIL